jgi:hypothetical protein
MTESDSVSNPGSELPIAISPPKPSKYWSTKFVLLNLAFILLAIIAGYLQYVAYPALMTAPTPENGGNGFGESNVVLNLSFLTFQLNATGTCSSSPCELKGVPAFDFCQAMIYLIIVINLVHLYNRRSK